MRRIIFAVLAVALLACGGDSTAPKLTDVTGAWTGTSGGVSMSLTLVQTGTTVTGSGNLTGGTTAIAVTASGTYAPPNLSLTLQSPGYQPINYAGTLANPDLINGTLNGSGFTNIALPITK
jgi:hypothetical protein